VPADPRRSARLCDVWAGGTNHDLADEDRARQIEQVIPGARELARLNREFLLGSVRWAAGQGVTQFLDLGCGLPGPDGRNTHDAAGPGALVVYADDDEDILDEATVMLGGEDERLPAGVAVARSDIWEPEKTLAAARDEGLDPGRPACLVLGLVLHYLDRDAAADVLGRYAAGIAPGSVVAATVRRVDDPEAWARLEAMTSPGVCNHTRLDLTAAAEAAGLEIVPPGAGVVGGMRPGWGDYRERVPGAAYCLGLVARKPGRR
jgi:hypothetical protein